MSTDITIETNAPPRPSFDDFALHRLPRLGRAVRVLAGDPEAADAALSAGVQSVFDDWADQRTLEEADQHVFAAAVLYCGEIARDDSADALMEVHRVTTSARSLAHHVFGWDDTVIRNALALRDDAPPATLDDPGAGEELRDRVAQAETAHVDLQAITARSKPAERRRVGQVTLAVLAALLTLGALAQFVARPDRTEPAQDAPATAREPSPSESAPRERASFPGENMDLEPSMPSAPQRPSLITSDGADGFVGVRLPSIGDSVAVFLTSSDGARWERVGSWDDPSTATIDRLERMGNRFVVWSEAPAGPQTVNPRLAISDDLVTWSVVDLPVLDPQPFGLLYRSRVSDVVVQSATVLALVTTEVEIDFAALSLSEGYTCGHSIADDAVSVNLCNSQLDVLSFSDVERLPAPNRLFVSRNGQPFERTTEPFGRETEAQLELVEDVFAIANETGLVFATSSDARTWLASAARKPPFPVRMSATNQTGQVLGTGTGLAGEPMLFFNNGPNTTSTLLSQIVTDVSSDVTVLVASGPSRWATYIYEPDGRAWIAASSDGLNWNVADAPAPRSLDVQFIANDEEGLVRSTHADGTVSNVSVPLP